MIDYYFIIHRMVYMKKLHTFDLLKMSAFSLNSSVILFACKLLSSNSMISPVVWCKYALIHSVVLEKFACAN